MVCVLHSDTHTLTNVFVDLPEAAGELALCTIIVSITRIYWDGGLFSFSLGLHCLLQLSSAGLIVVLVHGCGWAHSAFSV